MSGWRRRAAAGWRPAGWATLRLAAGLAALGLALAVPSHAGTFRVFGPRDFVRSEGEPVTELATFAVPSLATTYTLRIDNGGLEDSAYELVSSSVFGLDGVRVVGPDEFNQTVLVVEKPVAVGATNELSVELRGKPGGGVTVQIFGVDDEPPVIGASVDLAPNAAGWHNAAVTVRFTCTDAISGVSSCPGPVTVSAEGAGQVVTGTATDLAGNTASASVTINLDTTPPTLGAALSPAPNAAGWTNADTTVTFTAADDLSGVVAVTAPMVVTAEGADQAVLGEATDAAGNRAEATASVSLDATPPTLTPVVSPAANAAGWHRTAVTVSVLVEDAVSGVETPPAAVSVTTEGLGQLVEVAVADRAGNTGRAQVTVNVDATPPVITASVTPAPGANGWHRSPPTVSFACADTLSGVAACPAAVQVVTEGENLAIPGTAVDLAGNEATAEATVSLDMTAPVVTIASPPEGAFVPTPTVTVTGTVSEPAATLTVNGVAAAVGTDGAFGVEVPVGISATTLTAVATDPAGNVGTANRTITVDITPPVVRILAPADGQYVSQASLAVTGTIDDPTAAVTVNGVAAGVADGVFTAAGVALAGGPNTLVARAEDPAGNVGTDQVTVTYDAAPPALTASVPAEVTAGAPARLELAATDNFGLATLDILVDGRLVASGSTSPVSVSYLVPPERSVGEVLTVTLRAVDLAGNVTQQLASAPVTAAAVGPGFLRGLVLDDTRGLPLAGVTVAVGGTAGGLPVAPQETGADGQYAVSLDPGSVVVRFDKTGHTPVTRKVPVRSGLRTTVPDARLTPITAVPAVVGAAGGVAAVGDHALRLAVPAGALAADASVTLTPVSPQGLVARLPLGWSALLAADVAPDGVGFAQPATLTFALPEPLRPLLPPGAGVPVARYEYETTSWVALEPGTVTSDGLALEVAVSRLGPVAVLRADTASQAPPAPVAGSPLAGVSVADVPESATATSTITPGAVPPGQTTAAMAIAVASEPALPSGTTVQAVVTERYTLATGEPVTPPGFVQDVVLAACDAAGCRAAGTLAAAIPVTPSRAYTLQQLSVGAVTVAVQVPDASGLAGTIIGPGGGSVTAGDGTVLTIPAGALASETVVALTAVAEGDLHASLPSGVQVLRAVQVDLTRATLAAPADLALPLPAGLTATDQVLVGRVVEVDGLLRLTAVAAGRIEGGLLTSRGAVPGAALPGITAGGLYVVVRVDPPVGVVTGTITDASGAARPGVVVTGASGWVAVSRADGRYVVAAPAGSTTLVAHDGATGQGATQVVTVTAGAGASQALQVVPVPPRVVAVSPAPGALDVPVATPVTVSFSEALARTTVTPATVVLSGPAGALDTVVTLSPSGTLATIYPVKPLASQTTYTLVVSAAVTDLQGVPLPSPYTAPFTTVDTTPPPPPAAGAITVSFPDANGDVTVTATQGTAEPGAAVLVLNLSSGAAASTTAGADGSFQTTLFAFLGDELVVVITDAAGNQVVVSPGPYRSPAGESVVTAQGGVVEGAGGVRLTIPQGALDGPATVTVSSLGQADLPAPPPPGEGFAGGVRVASDQPFKSGVTVTMPIPAGMTIDPKARPYLARFEVIGGEQVAVMVDSMRVVNGTLTTSSPPFFGVLVPGDYFVFLPPIPLPALVSGIVSQRQADGTMKPLAGAVIRSGLRVARSGPDGRWALYVYPADPGVPETFVFIASDPASGVAQSKTVRVAAWAVNAVGTQLAGGVYALDFALDPAPPAADRTPPQVVIGVAAPSLQAGRVTVGDLVSVTLRATDDRGLRPDSVTLLVNGAPVPVLNTGNNQDYTASFTAGALDTLYTLTATARDASSNEGLAQARLLTISGAPPPSRPGVPYVLTSGLTPPDGAIDVNVFTELEVPFSEGITNLNATTVVLEALEPHALAEGVEQPAGAPVPIDLLLSGTTASDRVTVRPRGNLQFGTTYRLTLSGSLADQDGELLGQEVTTRFTTKALTQAAALAGNFRAVVRLDERYALLLERDKGVQVVDVALPTAPLPVGQPVKPFFYMAQPSAYTGLAVVRDLVYQVPGEAVPRLLPLAAVVVGFRWMPDEGAQALLGVLALTRQLEPVSGRETLVAQRLGDTVLADRTAGLPMRVLVKGPYALVSTTSLGVLVVDLAKALAVIANKEAFALHDRTSVVGLCDAGGELTFPIGLAAYRQDALVGDVTHGLYRLELGALPGLTGQKLLAMPVFRLEVVEAFEVLDPVTGVVTLKDLALISNADGLTIVDLGTEPPSVLKTLALPGGAPFDLAVNRERGLAFVASGSGGLTVVDLRQPSAPVVIGTRDDLGFVNGDLLIGPEYVYVTGVSGLQVIKYDPDGLIVDISSEDIAVDRGGQAVDGIFLIKNQYARGGATGDFPQPVMPRISVKARLPQQRQQEASQIGTIRWEITLDYRIRVRDDEARRGDSEPPDSRLVMRSRFVGRRVADMARPGSFECDGVHLHPHEASVSCGWPNTVLETPLDTLLVLPWPSGFVGGGELKVRATAMRHNGTPYPGLDTFADLQAGAAGQVFINGKRFTGDLAPGSNAPDPGWPRIEGQLTQALPGLTANLHSENTEARMGNATVDSNFRAKLVEYLTTPTTSVHAENILAEVGHATSRLLFRILAYQESVPPLRYAHLRKARFNSQQGTTDQLAAAVYPQLNAIGPRGGPFFTDGGFGIMQLTDPVPTYSQIWHWRRNIDTAIDVVIRDKVNQTIAYLKEIKRRPDGTVIEDRGAGVTKGHIRLDTYARYNSGSSFYVWIGGAIKKWRPRFATAADAPKGSGSRYAYEAQALEALEPKPSDF